MTKCQAYRVDFKFDQEEGSTSSVTNGVVGSDPSCDEKRASPNLNRE
jgi:hypothetical protein